MNEEGINASAILLLSIGEEAASEVFKYLAPNEVQKLGLAMASLGSVTRDKIDSVLERFRTNAEQHTSIGMDSDDYIRSVLVKALGNDKHKSEKFSASRKRMIARSRVTEPRALRK